MGNALKYKPKESKGKFPQGIARVKVGQKKAKITFTGDDAPEFDNGEVYKEFDLSDLPKVPHLGTDTVGEYMVKLNREADEVLSIGPVEGLFLAKCVDLSRPQGDEADPAPYEITPKQDGWASYLAFNAFFEIQKGPFKGVKIGQFHHYKFTDNGEGETIWDGNVDNPKAKWLPKLVEFCERTGCVDEPIEWPSDGNVLPELLERILDKGRELQIVVKNGYIDSLMGGKAVWDDDEENVDDEFPTPKKPVKSSNNGHKPAPAKTTTKAPVQAKQVNSKKKRVEL